MSFGGNWVDLIIIGVLVLFVVDSFGRPLISEVADFLSFLVAFFLSFRYYNQAAKFFEGNFSIPHGLSSVLGFMITWFLAETVFYLFIRLIWPRLPHIKIVGEKFLSTVPALFRGLIFICLVLVLLATFPIQPGIKKAVDKSKIGSFLLKQSYQLEEPVKNIFGGVAENSLTFLTIKPRTDERVNLGFQTKEIKVDPGVESLMIDLVNKERTNQGLKALTFDVSLRAVARVHSEDMFKRGYFSHYSPEGGSVVDRAKSQGVDYMVIGENLAYAPSLELAHKGLMNSEGHRANILSPDFNRIGIGVMEGGVYGKMFTQVFSN